MAARDLAPSPLLSILGNAPKTLHGRKIGVLISEGFNSTLLKELRESAKEERATLVVIAPNVGGANDAKGKLVEADMALSGAPSVLFDSVVVLASKAAADDLSTQAPAVDWGEGRLRAIAKCSVTRRMRKRFSKRPVSNPMAESSIWMGRKRSGTYIDTAKGGRIWGPRALRAAPRLAGEVADRMNLSRPARMIGCGEGA